MSIEWKSVVGYEGLYEVNKLGEVRSLPRPTTRGGILKPGKNFGGYCIVSLSKNNKQRTHTVHRLVMEAFVPNPQPEIIHINGVKTDNRLDNLEWCDRATNRRHASINGLLPKKTKRKLNQEIASVIRKRYVAGDTISLIAKDYPQVHYNTIHDICHNRSWNYV